MDPTTLAIPEPTNRKPTDLEKDVFERCILPSIKYRNEGIVAVCCQAYFTREMAKSKLCYAEHTTIMGTKEFRRANNITSETTFLSYLEKSGISPQIGGRRCDQLLVQKVDKQGQEIAELKAELVKLQKQIRSLGKRGHKLEHSLDYQIVSLAHMSCHGYTNCLECSRVWVNDDKILYNDYKRVLLKIKEGKFGPPSVETEKLLEARIAIMNDKENSEKINFPKLREAEAEQEAIARKKLKKPTN